MRDPVVVLLGKGVRAVREREYAEAEGLKLAADQTVYAHGRLLGVTRGGEPESTLEAAESIPTPKTTDSKSADGAPPKEAKK